MRYFLLVVLLLSRCSLMPNESEYRQVLSGSYTITQTAVQFFTAQGYPVASGETLSITANTEVFLTIAGTSTLVFNYHSVPRTDIAVFSLVNAPDRFISMKLVGNLITVRTNTLSSPDDPALFEWFAPFANRNQ